MKTEFGNLGIGHEIVFTVCKNKYGVESAKVLATIAKCVKTEKSRLECRSNDGTISCTKVWLGKQLVAAVYPCLPY